MSQEWGRNKYAGVWPNRHAAWTWSALFLALVSMVAICAYRYTKTWTPLQRFYLKTYIRSGLRSVTSFAKSDRYQMLTVVMKKGSHLAAEGEVTEAKTASGETTLALTDDAVKIGDLRLELQHVEINSGKLHELLGHSFYQDQTIMDFLRPALWGGLVVFFVCLAVAIPKDAARARERREGRRLKGPELVTPRVFNRRNRSNGVGFELTEKTFLQKLFGIVPRVSLPLAIEPNHILIMGDTGTGKSALIRRILQQIEERGETAIVYDPALDYTPEFYTTRARRRHSQSAQTQRMPYWSPGDELRHEAEALTFATSLVPRPPQREPILRRGTTENLRAPADLSADARAAGLVDVPRRRDRPASERHAVRGDDRPAGAAAAKRRAGLAQHGCRRSETACRRKRRRSGRWSARGMVEAPHGLAVPHEHAGDARSGSCRSRVCGSTRLVLRLMNQGQHESASRCGSFWTNSPACSGCRSCIRRSPRTANRTIRWCSASKDAASSRRATGMKPRRCCRSPPRRSSCARASRTRRNGSRTPSANRDRADAREPFERAVRQAQQNTKSYNLERQVEPLVMASEISGLENLHGYLKSGNLVVRMSFPFIELPAKQPKFIERPMEQPPGGATEDSSGRGGSWQRSPEQKFTQHEMNSRTANRNCNGASARQGHFFE